MSAVGGSTGTLINLLIGFFVGISAGATVTISQYFGGRHEREVSKAVHTAIAHANENRGMLPAGAALK